MFENMGGNIPGGNFADQWGLQPKIISFGGAMVN